MFMILTYFLPISSMSYTYVRVGLELWGSQSIGECTQRQLDNIRSKRRVSHMLRRQRAVSRNCVISQTRLKLFFLKVEWV
jgi:hypothetical protein